MPFLPAKSNRDAGSAALQAGPGKGLQPDAGMGPRGQPRQVEFVRIHVFKNLQCKSRASPRPQRPSNYPSGHSTVGTLMGIELSSMLPEKRAEIMARAWEYARNRVVGGIHYPSDIEMGRISGTVIAQTISTHPDFSQEFEAAKAELRAALGL